MGELKPIAEAHAEAEAFFEREDVQAIFQEAFALSMVKLPNYQLGKTWWRRMYQEPHPSKKKRDALYELERDLSFVAFALNRRVQSVEIKRDEMLWPWDKETE